MALRRRCGCLLLARYAQSADRALPGGIRGFGDGTLAARCQSRHDLHGVFVKFSYICIRLHCPCVESCKTMKLDLYTKFHMPMMFWMHSSFPLFGALQSLRRVVSALCGTGRLIQPWWICRGSPNKTLNSNMSNASSKVFLPQVDLFSC